MQNPQLSLTRVHKRMKVLNIAVKRYGYDHNDCVLGAEPGTIVIPRNATDPYAMCILKRLTLIIEEVTRPKDDPLHPRTGDAWIQYFDIRIIDPDGWRRTDGVRLDHSITVEDFAFRWLASTCKQPAPPALKAIFIAADL